MKTIILKPFLILALVMSTAFLSINAGQVLNGGGEILIELNQGFTIEDIIQDLQDNANIDVDATPTSIGNYSLVYDTKTVDIDTIVQFIDAHPGVELLLYRK